MTPPRIIAKGMVSEDFIRVAYHQKTTTRRGVGLLLRVCIKTETAYVVERCRPVTAKYKKNSPSHSRKIIAVVTTPAIIVPAA